MQDVNYISINLLKKKGKEGEKKEKLPPGKAGLIFLTETLNNPIEKNDKRWNRKIY